MHFTPLESDVIAWIREHAPNAALQEQLRTAAPTRREHTGAGRCIDLTVPSTSHPATHAGRTISGPHIQSPNLEHGGGSVLFMRDGIVESLELYAFGNTFPEELTDYSLAPDHP